MTEQRKQSSDFSLIDPYLAQKAGTAKAEGSLISILQKAQDAYGYLSTELMEYIAAKTDIKPAKILGVATFYSQFKFSPVGKHLIMLCQGTACHVNGASEIQDAISARLGIAEGETTKDGMFTFNSVACLGCCSLSPVMMIDGEAYGSLTPLTTRKILDEMYKSESGVEK
ncbi:MAG: NADH-quinone oxidoreductase subunit NuoE [Deltaproteobacteria bacterium]|nr:NADH-quinone oxidoreductase subunit NuoE [Deltaproteobacteria bacterium]